VWIRALVGEVVLLAWARARELADLKHHPQMARFSGAERLNGFRYALGTLHLGRRPKNQVWPGFFVALPPLTLLERQRRLSRGR
jgi:hypothetical protein